MYRFLYNIAHYAGHFVELPYFSDDFLDASIAMKESYVKSLLFAFMHKGEDNNFPH